MIAADQTLERTDLAPAVFYRYQETRYSGGVLMLLKSTFPVLKTTPSGVWLDVYGSRRFVRSDARKAVRLPDRAGRARVVPRQEASPGQDSARAAGQRRGGAAAAAGWRDVADRAAMNQRRRFKAKRRRLEVKRTMSILQVNRANAVAFLQGRYKPRRRARVDVHRANRRMEMMFPRSGVFGDSLIGGPRT